MTANHGGRFFPRRVTLAAGLATALTCGFGCSGGDSAGRSDLSGAATFAGKPIAAGTISFAPDAGQGNDGPGSTGEIRNGRYQTRAGKGVVGGPYVVTIHGYAAEGSAELLFAPYEVKVSLPENGGIHDFDVPASAPKPAATPSESRPD